MPEDREFWAKFFWAKSIIGGLPALRNKISWSALTDEQISKIVDLANKLDWEMRQHDS